MKNISIFISGRGSNLESILKKWKSGNIKCNIPFVLSSNENAYGSIIANKYGIKVHIIDPKKEKSRQEFENKILDLTKKNNIDLIILAGFMILISSDFLSSFKGEIINIHPSILPSFPGLNSQKRAFEYGVKYSGCTVHFVTEETDGGPIIMQGIVPCYDSDNAETLTSRILKKEHVILPKVVKMIVEGKIERVGRRILIKE
jgi:phosphoribosylglycinamide formyltransferase 1